MKTEVVLKLPNKYSTWSFFLCLMKTEVVLKSLKNTMTKACYTFNENRSCIEIGKIQLH